MIETNSKWNLVRKILKVAFIVAIFVILYFPILLIILLSFNESRTGTSFTGFSFEWYLDIFKTKSLYTSILNTLLVAVWSTLFAVILGVMAAIGINALSKKNRKLMNFLNNIPMLNPEVVTGVSLMIMFAVLIPLMPHLFGFWTMLIAHVFFTTPYVIMNVYPKVRGTDESLFEAAMDLGCSPMKSLIKVVLPSLTTAIVTGALLAFTLSIDDFVISFFTGGGGFTNFSNWIYARLGKKTFSPAAYAYNALITIVVISGVILVTLKRDKKKKKVSK